LTSSELAGRPLGEWSDAELDDFARRYNVGYVAGWSPAVVQRFQTWPKAEPVVQLHNDGEGWLFQIKRTPSFVLKGRARILEWNAQRIALADVEPEDGVVILSLHHLDGFRVAPSDIFVEQQPDAFDPIPFLRLRMTKPAMRVTLTWGD